ncbi:hypothetical protein BB561_000987 [Smittium simulii]|uniref:protein-tyrosine-phosphatase n=1 Tax=Smittium simulii TaxID=133385 RepID=A0A2T9YWP6_9FUNG|nr:hypothetical protein BB561_000987 [Smittium simulii]
MSDTEELEHSTQDQTLNFASTKNNAFLPTSTLQQFPLHSGSVQPFIAEGPLSGINQIVASKEADNPANNDKSLHNILDYYKSSSRDVFANNTIGTSFLNSSNAYEPPTVPHFNSLSSKLKHHSSTLSKTFKRGKLKDSIEIYTLQKNNTADSAIDNFASSKSPIAQTSSDALTPINSEYPFPQSSSDTPAYFADLSKKYQNLQHSSSTISDSKKLDESNNHSKIYDFLYQQFPQMPQASISKISSKDASMLVEQSISLLHIQSNIPLLSFNSPTHDSNVSLYYKSLFDHSSFLPNTTEIDSSSNPFSLIVIDAQNQDDYDFAHIIGAISYSHLLFNGEDIVEIVKSTQKELDYLFINRNLHLNNSLPDKLSSSPTSQSADSFSFSKKVLIYDDGNLRDAAKLASILNSCSIFSSIYILSSGFAKFSKNFDHLCVFQDSLFPEYLLFKKKIDSKLFSLNDLSYTKTNLLDYESFDIDSTPDPNYIKPKLKLSDYKIPEWLHLRSSESCTDLGVAMGYFNKIETAEKRRVKNILNKSSKKDSLSSNYQFSNSFNRFVQNRYPNILPYDHSRILISDNGYGEDYINASNVGLPNGPQYIVTQGPMKSTVSDFWHMIWDKKVGVIVMLGDIIEKNQEKCYQYWPKSFDTWKRYKLKDSTPDSNFNAIISVKLEAETEDCNFPEIKVRLFRIRLTIRDTLVGKARLLTQIHYKNWSDNQVPSDPQTFLRVINLVNYAMGYTMFNLSEKQQVVVHCSAGCGRSGVFCAVDTALRLKKGNNPVVTESYDPLYSIVSAMRRQRMGIVQTLEQFLFCYKSIKASFYDPMLTYPQLDVVAVSTEQLKLVTRWNRLRSKIYAPDSAHMVWIMVAFMEIANELRIIKRDCNQKAINYKFYSYSPPFMNERRFSTFGMSLNSGGLHNNKNIQTSDTLTPSIINLNTSQNLKNISKSTSIKNDYKKSRVDSRNLFNDKNNKFYSQKTFIDNGDEDDSDNSVEEPTNRFDKNKKFEHEEAQRSKSLNINMLNYSSSATNRIPKKLQQANNSQQSKLILEPVENSDLYQNENNLTINLETDMNLKANTKNRNSNILRQSQNNQFNFQNNESINFDKPIASPMIFLNSNHESHLLGPLNPTNNSTKTTHTSNNDIMPFVFTKKVVKKANAEKIGKLALNLTSSFIHQNPSNEKHNLTIKSSNIPVCKEKFLFDPPLTSAFKKVNSQKSNSCLKLPNQLNCPESNTSSKQLYNTEKALPELNATKKNLTIVTNGFEKSTIGIQSAIDPNTFKKEKIGNLYKSKKYPIQTIPLSINTQPQRFFSDRGLDNKIKSLEYKKNLLSITNSTNFDGTLYSHLSSNTNSASHNVTGKTTKVQFPKLPEIKFASLPRNSNLIDLNKLEFLTSDELNGIKQSLSTPATFSKANSSKFLKNVKKSTKALQANTFEKSQSSFSSNFLFNSNKTENVNTSKSLSAIAQTKSENNVTNQLQTSQVIEKALIENTDNIDKALKLKSKPIAAQDQDSNKKQYHEFDNIVYSASTYQKVINISPIDEYTYPKPDINYNTSIKLDDHSNYKDYNNQQKLSFSKKLLSKKDIIVFPRLEATPEPYWP